jgi:McbB family protein
MTIKICNYEILNFDDDRILISEKGIHKINNSKLWDALSEINSLTDKEIENNELSEIIARHGLPHDSTVDYLKKTLKIREALNLAPYEKVIIIHDLSNAKRLECHAHNEIIKDCEIFQTRNFEPETIRNTKNFFVLLAEKYNYQKLSELYFKIATLAPQSAICVAYSISDCYCVSQPYIPEIGNPCHFCGLDRLIDYETRLKSNSSWASLLHFCKGKGINIPVKKKTFLQDSMAFGLIFQRVNLYTSPGSARRHQDSVLASATMNLTTGLISEEIISHWFLCKCLGTHQ